MSKISSPIAPIAGLAIILASASSMSVPTGSARANDCLSAPKSPSPHGQHWYYHLERSGGRKCWYLHSFLSRPHRSARHSERHSDSHAIATAATNAAPVAAPQPSTHAAVPKNPAEGTLRQPEVKILPVRTVQFPDSTDQDLQQSAQRQTDAGPVPPAIAGSGKTLPLKMAEPPNEDAHPAPPKATVNPQRADASGKPDALTTIGPAETFFLLALGMGLTVFLLAAVIKIAGIQRTPSIREDPDSIWRRYRLRDQRSDLYGSRQDQDQQFGGPQRTQQSARKHRPYGVAETEPTGLLAMQPEDQVRAVAAPAGPSLKDLEPALRALGQAREMA